MVLKLMCPDIWQYQVLGLEVAVGAALFSEQVHAFECHVILLVFLFFCSQESRWLSHPVSVLLA